VRRLLMTVGFCVGGALALATPARAADFVFSLGTSGTGLAASATFHDAGAGNLEITLANIGGDVDDPPDVLTTLFFNCSCGTLTPVSAVLAGGSTVLFGADGGGNVGGEWAYLGSVAGPGGATRGISSSGMGGLFGSPNFGGPDLNGQAALGGLGYGITSAVDNPTTGNAAVTGGNELIQNSVKFTLSGFNGNMSFSNISFQYGTSMTEPNLGGGTGGGSGQQLVPEPTSLLLFGSGLSMVAYRTRRRKENKSS